MRVCVCVCVCVCVYACVGPRLNARCSAQEAEVLPVQWPSGRVYNFCVAETNTSEYLNVCASVRLSVCACLRQDVLRWFISFSEYCIFLELLWLKIDS